MTSQTILLFKVTYMYNYVAYMYNYVYIHENIPVKKKPVMCKFYIDWFVSLCPWIRRKWGRGYECICPLCMLFTLTLTITYAETNLDHNLWNNREWFGISLVHYLHSFIECLHLLANIYFNRVCVSPSFFLFQTNLLSVYVWKYQAKVTLIVTYI